MAPMPSQWLQRLKSPHTDRLVFYCRTTSASTAPCTSRRMCSLMHCASYCAPRQPLLPAFFGWIRSPPPTVLTHVHHTVQEPGKCAICLGEYEEGENVLTLPCLHRFHEVNPFFSRNVRLDLFSIRRSTQNRSTQEWARWSLLPNDLRILKYTR